MVRRRRRRRKSALVVEDVVLYARDADGNEWKLTADEASIEFDGEVFRARFARRDPWGKCEAQIIRLGSPVVKLGPK